MVNKTWIKWTREEEIAAREAWVRGEKVKQIQRSTLSHRTTKSISDRLRMLGCSYSTKAHKTTLTISITKGQKRLIEADAFACNLTITEFIRRVWMNSRRCQSHASKPETYRAGYEAGYNIAMHRARKDAICGETDATKEKKPCTT